GASSPSVPVSATQASSTARTPRPAHDGGVHAAPVTTPEREARRRGRRQRRRALTGAPEGAHPGRILGKGPGSHDVPLFRAAGPRFTRNVNGRRSNGRRRVAFHLLVPAPELRRASARPGNGVRR